MTFGDVFSPAPAAPEKAQGTLLPAILFGEIAAYRIAYHSGYGYALAPRQDVEIVLDSLVDKQSRTFHMTYSSI